jgi:2-epi-valiolone-7-phosphate 1-reductase
MTGNRETHWQLVRESGVFACEARKESHPAPGVVRVAPQLVGLCGTDKQMLAGERNDPAVIIGHEGVGVVTHTSPRLRNELAVGTRVAFNPVALKNQDEVLGHSVPGLLQHCVDFEGEDDDVLHSLFPYDKSLDDDVACLLEPLATAVYGFEIMHACAERTLDSVAIYGAGTIGLLNAIIAEAEGIQSTLVTHSQERAAWLKHSQILTTTRIAVTGATSATVGRDDLSDAAVIACPRRVGEAYLRTALSQVRAGGVIDLVTSIGGSLGEELNVVRRQNVIGSDPRSIAMGSAHIVGHRGTAVRHIRTAEALLVSDGAMFRQLITHRVPAASLDRKHWQEVLGVAGAVKVLIDLGSQECL